MPNHQLVFLLVEELVVEVEVVVRGTLVLGEL